MDKITHEDKVFDKIDYSEKELSGRDFIKCTFTNCNFSKSDLSYNDFIDCSFSNCNFSLTVFSGTGLKDIRFTNCKLLGIDFSVCNSFLFSVNFRGCHLDYSSFFQKRMKKTEFLNCSLKEVDFAETDLSLALFKDCDLQGSSFNRTVLEKVDFRTAVNYSFDPDLNKIKKAKFSCLGIAGLLTKYNIDIEYKVF